MEFMFLNIDLSDFGGIFASTSHISSKYLDSLSTIAFVVSILALLGLILFIVMIIKQIRGIFGISDGRRVKKAHGIALGTYAIVTFCSMIYFLNLAMCVSDSGNDFSLFYGYAGFAARVVFFVVVLILFGLIRKKYNTAVDLFFETREQETASNVAKTSQDASSNYDNSKTKQLLELKSLLDKGLLTQEEFNNEKRKILNKNNVSDNNTAEDEAAQNVGTSPCLYDDEGQKHIETNAPKSLSHKVVIGIAIVAVILIAILANTCTGEDSGASGEVIPTDSTLTYENFTNATDTFFYSETHRAIDDAATSTISVAEFFAMPEIANAVQNEYGLDYFNFLKGVVSSCNNINLDIEKNSDGDGSVASYAFSTPLDADEHWWIRGTYDVQADNLHLSLSSNGNIVNPDGTFALHEGSKWKLGYEKDEFGDPIKEKAYVYVEGESDDFSSHLLIAIPMNNESQVIFYYELPQSDIYDNHYLSIKVKDKTDDSIYEIKEGECFLKHYILTEKDSRYIRQLCDGHPSGSFSIRFDIVDYDLFYGGEKNYTIVNFDNGRAYGASNAIAHYFKRAFTVN